MRFASPPSSAPSTLSVVPLAGSLTGFGLAAAGCATVGAGSVITFAVAVAVTLPTVAVIVYEPTVSGAVYKPVESIEPPLGSVDQMICGGGAIELLNWSN